LLGIRHYVVDLSEAFSRQVIDYFCKEYTRDGLPTPVSNVIISIKFGALWEKAQELGAEMRGYRSLCTRSHTITAGCCSKKGRDKKKDQSYVLYT